MRPGRTLLVPLLLVSPLLPILAPPVRAQSPPPSLLGFQGRLTDASGNPVTADVSMTFTLYFDSAGTSPTGWSESRAVAVTAGLYHVLLGEGTPLVPADFAQALWRGIADNADPEMTPRYRLAPGAYALRATTAASATTAANLSGSLAGDVTGTQGATAVSKLQGLTLAIGTPAAGQALKWNGSAWAPADDANTTYGAGDGLSLAGTSTRIDECIRPLETRSRNGRMRSVGQPEIENNLRFGPQ